MDFEQEQQLVAEVKKYVTENLPLSKMSDEELADKIEEIALQKLQENIALRTDPHRASFLFHPWFRILDGILR